MSKTTFFPVKFYIFYKTMKFVFVPEIKKKCKNEMVIRTLCPLHLKILPKMWPKPSAKSFGLKPSATEAKAKGQKTSPSVDPCKRVSIIKEYTGKFQKMLKEYDLIKEYAGKYEVSINEY